MLYRILLSLRHLQFTLLTVPSVLSSRKSNLFWFSDTQMHASICQSSLFLLCFIQQSYIRLGSVILSWEELRQTIFLEATSSSTTTTGNEPSHPRERHLKLLHSWENWEPTSFKKTGEDEIGLPTRHPNQGYSKLIRLKIKFKNMIKDQKML